MKTSIILLGTLYSVSKINKLEILFNGKPLFLNKLIPSKKILIYLGILLTILHL